MMSQNCKYDHHEFHLLVGYVVHGRCKKISPSILEIELHIFLTIALLNTPPALSQTGFVVWMTCMVVDGGMKYEFACGVWLVGQSK